MMSSLSESDRDRLEARLKDRGYSDTGRRRVLRSIDRATAALSTAGAGRRPRWIVVVPGRIEVVGKHTDYAGGRSLTCATERSFCLAVAPTPDATLRIMRAATGETVSTSFDQPITPPAGHWSNYPLTVARRVLQDFERPPQGGVIAFASSLPPAAGMSSSSAMIVAFFLALRALNNLAARSRYQTHLAPAEALAAYLGAVEGGRPFGPFAAQDGVGTRGGSQDHTAILCAAPGSLRGFRYRPVQRVATADFSDEHRFVIGVSGVTAPKTGAAQGRYNQAAARARRAAHRWREATGYDDPHLGAAFARTGGRFDPVRAVLAQAADAAPLIRRAEHFYVEEHQVVPAVLAAWSAHDWTTLGEAVDRSQRAAERLLGNQVPETAFLARSARQQGAIAASAFGAGFGGAVWALVPRHDAAAFRAAWAEAYATHSPAHAEAARFFTERPGPAAAVFRLDG